MFPGSAEKTRTQKSSPTSSLPNQHSKESEADDKEEEKKTDDAPNVNTKDQSSVNDDLELSDDEMDKDSGSSNSSNEAGCVLLGSTVWFFASPLIRV